MDAGRLRPLWNLSASAEPECSTSERVPQSLCRPDMLNRKGMRRSRIEGSDSKAASMTHRERHSPTSSAPFVTAGSRASVSQHPSTPRQHAQLQSRNSGWQHWPEHNLTEHKPWLQKVMDEPCLQGGTGSHQYMVSCLRFLRVLSSQ